MGERLGANGSNVDAPAVEGRVSERFVTTSDGTRVCLTTYGSAKLGRPPILLLHGFPQSAYAWRETLRSLGDRGFEVIAPDMRGYDRSDKPASVSAYGMDRLVDDVAEIASSLGHPRIFLVGHDWGGAVAWAVAARYPELVQRLAILNAPHPKAMVRELRRSPKQRRSSWYIFYFQLPFLPERTLTRKGTIARVLTQTSRGPAVFTEGDLDYYEAAVRKPGAATAMLNYYRAMGRALLHRADKVPMPKIACPTLVLWGTKDKSLQETLLDGLDRYADDLTIKRYSNASHWIVEEEPAAVSQELANFFSST